MNSKSKWMLSVVSAILALTMVMPSVSANGLSDLKKEQQDAERKKNELNSNINEKANEISENQSTLEKIVAKINDLENKITETQDKMTAVQAEIDQTKSEIDELKESIEELENKIAEREELLKERARAIQLSGGSVDYIDVLLGANSFIDFIDRFSAVNLLIDADREIMREQAEDKELLAEQQAEVESKLAEQQKRQAELEELKSSLDKQKKEQSGLKADLEAEQERLAEEKSALEKEHEEAMGISDALQKKIAEEQTRLAKIAKKAEEERKRKEAAERAAAQKSSSSSVTTFSAPVKNSSGFIRPAAGRLSSNYGGRNIGAGNENHLGVDIANSTGTPIHAAASGYVSFSGAMGGYGNVVMITHSINGQPYTTVYAHNNSNSVSVGQAVSQGQRIAAMGSTGRSTGPHVHFEVHIGSWNGARSNAVNPINYIGG
ncbi:murein hydrolase activator EnvC family protein [Planococcus sp. X10-3]|uniref:murein hydrolase activator EnvC family protein n=1 Tax=Planococcus sp. X10-3 TaxID=3061240 RepID=UPI003BB0FAA3